MVYVLAARPRLYHVASRHVHATRRFLSCSPDRLIKASSNHLATATKQNKTINNNRNNKLFRKRNVALVSGVIIVGSYITFNQSNYYNLDTVPPPLTGSATTTKGSSFLLPITGNTGTPSFGSSIVAAQKQQEQQLQQQQIPPSSTGSGSSSSVTNSDPSSTKKYFSTSTSSMNQNSIGNSQHKEGVFLLNEEQVSHKLRQFEESYLVNRGKGVTRYDICQVPSNSPIEDDRAEEIVSVPILQDNNIKTSTDWMFFGVFDGHGGWTTSSKLRDQLISYIIREFGTIFKPANEDSLRYVPNSATIDQAIKNGFLKLDHEIVNKNMEKLLNDNNKAKAAELLMPALSGSCALLSFYDTNSKLLKVAVTGDSRALLGSFKDNHWTVKQLSTDQTGSNPTEVARIISEHPDEPNVIRNGRVLGTLEPSRAFGDCRYKLPASIQERIYKQFFGRRLPNNLKSPPYVTAEPVITTTKISPENNDFLVMASDGLYEMLSNEEIVGLVVKWMEKEKMIKPQKSFWNYFGSTENKLPEVADVTNDKSSKQPFRKTKQSGGYGSFLLEDRNVSTHLIRNALSNGGSREQTSMLISIPSPVSRRYRDDLSVTVVFFGKDVNGENEAGRLEINGVATSGGQTSPKPKL
ncbi:[Pyruvate dehydrogenase [acetyl-transferring]]-phosphatase 1, mitochondrial [[Candida] anglica]